MDMTPVFPETPEQPETEIPATESDDTVSAVSPEKEAAETKRAVPETASIPVTDTTAAENGFRAAFGGNSDNLPPEPAPLDLDKLVQGLVRTQEGNAWVYSLEDDRAFLHHINRGQFVMATPAASHNDRMVLAALLAARADADQFRRGGLEITGSAAFQEKVLDLIVAHNIDVKLVNPAQRDALEKRRQETDEVKDSLSVSATAEATAAVTPAQSAPKTTTTPEGSTPASTATAKERPPAAEEKKQRAWAAPRTGVLEAHGPARYRFSPRNNDSYYAKLRTAEGEKIYWGKELQQAIADSGVQPGEVITLQFMGKQPVSINAPVRDENGSIERYEKIDTERNQWAVRPAIDNTRLVASAAQATPPSSLSVYDATQFWQLQQQVANAAGMPFPSVKTSPGLLWLGPDGKGQIPPQTPPDNVTVPAPARSAGSVMMQAYDSDKNLQLHLVKAHGDHLQGLVRQGETWLNVLGKLCTRRDGSTFMALNSINPDGKISALGHGNAVNQVKGAKVSFDTFAFDLKGMPKIVATLCNPQGMPPALHQKLGFTQQYTPPDKATLVEKPAPRAQTRHTMQPG